MAGKKRNTATPASLALQAPEQPKFLVKDAVGVVIDIDQKDPGSAHRHDKGQALDKGSIADKIGDVKLSDVEVEGKIRRAYKVQDVLDIMVRNQTITKEEFSAGKRFKFYHDLSGRYHITAVNFDRSGGGVSREDFLNAQINATRKVEAIIEHLGGANAIASSALVNIIGKGASFDHMATYTGLGKHYWRGALKAALGGLIGYFNKAK